MVSRAIAYTNATNDDWVMATPETRLVRVAEDVLDKFGTRTEDGRKITARWSEPYDDGTYEIIFSISGEPELTMLRKKCISIDESPEYWAVERYEGEWHVTVQGNCKAHHPRIDMAIDLARYREGV